jgi:hypothetical protein
MNKEGVPFLIRECFEIVVLAGCIMHELAVAISELVYRVPKVIKYTG